MTHEEFEPVDVEREPPTHLSHWVRDLTGAEVGVFFARLTGWDQDGRVAYAYAIQPTRDHKVTALPERVSRWFGSEARRESGLHRALVSAKHRAECRYGNKREEIAR